MWEAFGPEIWIVDGPVVTAAAGFHYPTRMTVIRLAGGDLVIWSPVALTAQLRGEVEVLGNIRYLVAPNSLHDSFIADWHRAFPVAQVLAAGCPREASRPQVRGGSRQHAGTRLDRRDRGRPGAR